MKHCAKRIGDFLNKWQAWNRVLSLMTALTLSWAFIGEAKDRTVDQWDYIGYSIAMVITYSPVAAAKLITAIKGQPGDTSTSTATVTQIDTHTAAPEKGVD